MKLEEVLPEGASATRSLVVTKELTVGGWVDGMPYVFGTPFLVYLMEVAAAEVLAPYLPQGWISVGTKVDVTHHAATPLGMTVTATARLTSAWGRTATFAVEAHDGIDRIGSGTHVRALVPSDRLEARVREKAAMAAETLPGTLPQAKRP